MTNVEIRGLNRTVRKLQRVGNNRVLVRPMTQSVSHAQNVISQYPPSSEANVPPAPYYKRGIGTVLASGAVRRTSERLGSRWQTRVLRGGLRGIVENATSYVLWVHDKIKQASFHRRRGWKTDEEVIEQESRTILGFFQAAYRRVLNE